MVGISTNDIFVPCGLVYSREHFRRLFVVPSSGNDGDRYGDDLRSKAQEALCVAYNSVTAVDVTILEEGVDKILLSYVYRTHRVVCLV